MADRSGRDVEASIPQRLCLNPRPSHASGISKAALVSTSQPLPTNGAGVSGSR